MLLHEKFMNQAYFEAEKAWAKNEVPVGAVVVEDGVVVGRGYNLVEWLQDPTAHAEILAITAASNKLASWRLDSCVLYVTLEPCPMCAGAILMSRISTVVFGAADPRYGVCGSNYNLLNDKKLNSHIQVVGGVLDEKCCQLLQMFFQRLRENRKKIKF